MALPNSFSTFLETTSSGGGSGANAPAANPLVVRRILDVLQSETAVDISQLSSRIGGDFFEIANALQNLRKLDAVTVEQQGSVQLARLGPNWETVVSLMK